MKRIISFLIFLFLFQSLFAQETIFEEKSTVFSEEISGGIGAHTNGFQATFRYAKYLTGYTKRLYELEVANIRHPKEIRSINPFESNIRGYIYGKLNSYYAIRPSIGFQKVFVPKQSIRGVSITYVAQFGPSIGLAKPIYLNIIKREPFTGKSAITKEKYDPKVHNQSDIYGRSSFVNGVDEIKLYPGLFGKFGLHFDYGGDREVLRSVEVGIQLDAYFSAIPILALTTNRAFYPNIYLAMFFGSRETK